jgi:N-acetylglucosamine kinase-like BadF-type ATPase
MSYYLCVDCGGSKTSVAIGTPDGIILGRAVTGPSNYAYLGIDTFLNAVSSAISSALEKIDPKPDSTTLPPPNRLFISAWFGVSGCDSPKAISDITAPLSSLLNIAPSQVSVANDTLLLASPLIGSKDERVKSCITAIGGTGSVCVTFKKTERNTLIEQGRIGGWGWLLGDEGGGFYLGREAVRQALMAYDEASHSPESRKESTLTNALLSLYGIKEMPEILPLIHMVDPPLSSAPAAADLPPYLTMPREKRLSSLSPLVFKCAFEDGDEIAMRALKACASSLADQICRLLAPESSEKVGRRAKASESLLIFGGSLVMIESYRQLVLNDLKERGHVFRSVHTLKPHPRVLRSYDRGVECVADAAGVGCSALAVSSRN